VAVKPSCLIALLAACPLLTALAATEPTGSLVRVTTVVTNVRGEPVQGLRPADFELTVDGKPQPVEAAEFRSDGARAARVLALVLDEFHVPATHGPSVRDALLPLVDANFRAGDFALVVKPLDPLTTIQPTSDRRALLASIASFDARQGDYTPKTLFERKYMAHAPAAMAAARAQIVTSAVRAVASTLGELRDVRPVLVLVSDGFPRQRADRNVPANLLSAVRVANRAEVPAYVFAPSAEPSADPAASQGDTGHATLRAFAADTGGAFTSGVASFAGGMARMIRELEAHYVLTYRAPHADDGRFHSVAVTSRRPATVVRARTGYVAALAEPARPASGPALSMRALRRSPLIRAWSGVLRGETGTPRVTLTWEPSAPQAPAVPSPASIVVTATTADGTLLFDGRIAPVGPPGIASTANRAEFDAPAGRVLIDAKVLDAKGVVLDTDSRDIDVPALRPSRATILSPAVLRASSAREFRAIVEDPLAAPAPSREFRRTERLLLRVPAYQPDGTPARVSATLLNRWRQPMRAVPAMDVTPQPGVTQFEVPLAPLAPGEYSIRLTAGTTVEHVTFRVRG
jgi:VWFA-related protein